MGAGAMDAILLQILNGLDKGSAYSMIALGLTLIFGTLGVVNFAHGALFMLGAFCAVSIKALLGLDKVTLDPTQTTAWGTPHRPCPRDFAGFERHESADNAEYLIKKENIPPSDVVEESVSLETVGDAYFSRVMHTDVMGARRIAVTSNSWHMSTMHEHTVLPCQRRAERARPILDPERTSDLQ